MNKQEYKKPEIVELSNLETNSGTNPGMESNQQGGLKNRS